MSYDGAGGLTFFRYSVPPVQGAPQSADGRLAAKTAAFVAFLAGYLFLGALLAAFAAGARWRHEVNTVFARIVLKVMGFRVRTLGAAQLMGLHGGALYVANHVGFWDMLVLSRLFPLSYVTSVEVRETPLLGAIARYSGCLFSERRDRSGVEAEVGAVAAALRDGIAVGLFAEGTSTDGSYVAPFKRRFFKAAMDAGAPVVPVTINYIALDGRPIGPEHMDEVSYYGSHDFIPQLLRVFRFKRIDVEVLIHSPIDPASVPGCEALSEVARHRVVSAHRASGAALS